MRKHSKKDDGPVAVPKMSTELGEANTGVDQPISLAKEMERRLGEEDGDKNDG